MVRSASKDEPLGSDIRTNPSFFLMFHFSCVQLAVLKYYYRKIGAMFFILYAQYNIRVILISRLCFAIYVLFC